MSSPTTRIGSATSDTSQFRMRGKDVLSEVVGEMSFTEAFYFIVTGRELDEEAKRLARVFKSATRYSLILLNEVLAGTSAIEALGIAFDAMRGLRLLGARAIYTTHLHELAARADEINAGTPGDALVGSLVAQVDEEADAAQSHHARTFRIIAGPPRGSSYASEIAEQHGISYPQLEELLHEREQVAKPSAKS